MKTRRFDRDDDDTESIWLLVCVVITFAVIWMFSGGLSGCIPAMLRARDAELMYEQSLGYRPSGETFERYVVDKPILSPGGVTYQGPVESVALLDEVTDKILSCMHAEARKKDFRVRIADDWFWNCDHTEQLLPIKEGPNGCIAKGLNPTPECPCRARDGVHGPNIIVTTPNLKLYPRALVVWLKGPDYFLKDDYNPWRDPIVLPCLGPFEPPPKYWSESD